MKQGSGSKAGIQLTLNQTGEKRVLAFFINHRLSKWCQ